jgi:dTDP-4-dehydrorhamnose reductase
VNLAFLLNEGFPSSDQNPFLGGGMAAVKCILIIGGSGFIGSHLAMRLREKHKVYATYQYNPLIIPNVTFFPSKLENRDWVKRMIYTIKPDVIIYATGDNDLDRAEKEDRRTEQLHGAGPATVANVSELVHSKFIYISNSYVFDGNRGNYHESDIALPWSVLGKAKVSGENYIRGKCLDYVLIRPTPLYGRGLGHQFTLLDRMRRALDQGLKFELPTQELHGFASVNDFSDMMSHVIDAGVHNRILHFGGVTKVDYYTFGKMFAETFGYDPSLIVQAKKKQQKSGNELIDEPTMDYSLNCSMMAELLKVKPLDLQESLDSFRSSLEPKSSSLQTQELRG